MCFYHGLFKTNYCYDIGQLSRMGDSYPLQILNFTNERELILYNKWYATTLFFPYACLISYIIIRNHILFNTKYYCKLAELKGKKGDGVQK